METSDPVLKGVMNAVVLILILYVIAIPFYMYFEGFTLIEAFYFTSVTITTVGYGDLHPITTVGRIFTVALIFSGVSIFFYHVTHLGQFRERNIDPYVQRRLQVLRNLTALHTGEVEKTELKKIRSKIEASDALKSGSKPDKSRITDEKARDFGRI